MGQSLLILVDTHVVIWLAFEEARLSKKARAAILEARLNGEGLAISDISLFELARAFARERSHLDISVESALTEVQRRFIVLPINSRISLRARNLFQNRRRHSLPHSPGSRRRLQLLGDLCHHVQDGCGRRHHASGRYASCQRPLSLRPRLSSGTGRSSTGIGRGCADPQPGLRL